MTHTVKITSSFLRDHFEGLKNNTMGYNITKKEAERVYTLVRHASHAGAEAHGFGRVESIVISFVFHQYQQMRGRPMLTTYSEIDCPTDKTHIEKLLVFVFLTNFVEFFDQFGRNEFWVGAAPAAKSISATGGNLFQHSCRFLHRAIQEVFELVAQGRALFPLCIFKPKRSESPIVPNVRSATSMGVLNRPDAGSSASIQACPSTGPCDVTPSV